MVFYYRYSPDDERHSVYYRPALLNGRHIVDVLRAVCGPTDLSEAELDRVRREATEGARDELWISDGRKDVWWTRWWGAAITVKK